jgi:hypothetical protein
LARIRGSVSKKPRGEGVGKYDFPRGAVASIPVKTRETVLLSSNLCKSMASGVLGGSKKSCMISVKMPLIIPDS